MEKLFSVKFKYLLGRFLALAIPSFVVMAVPLVVNAELTMSEDMALWEIQELTRQCNNGSMEKCIFGLNIAREFKRYESAAHLAKSACDLGHKQACIGFPEFAASIGDFEKFEMSLPFACKSGSNLHCTLEKSENERRKSFESILEANNPRQFKEYKSQILKESERENHTKQYQVNKTKCENGATQTCLTAGKTLASRESHSLALPLFESACDRKSAEACELAGLSASKLDQGDYAITLVGIACKLGRLSACRLQGKIAQEMKNRERSEQEMLNSELNRKDQIAYEKQSEAVRLAEEREQERIDQIERSRTNAALLSAGQALGAAIAGVPPAGSQNSLNQQQPLPAFPVIKSRNTRKCKTKSTYNGLETVCEDQGF